MTTIICVSGPPFHTPLWADVEKRLQKHGLNTQTWALLDTDTGDFNAELSAFTARLDRMDGPIVVMAHGLANPLVIAATHAGRVSGVVLSNGPTIRPDRWTTVVKWVGKTPRHLTMAWLRSSAGLRRLVVNPYVMDRDTTVAVCAPIIDDKRRRNRMQHYLDSIAWGAPKPGTKMLLCEGDNDPLTCRNHEYFIESFEGEVTRSPVPGGRMLHPLERPWEIADRVADWITNQVTATQMS